MNEVRLERTGIVVNKNGFWGFTSPACFQWKKPDIILKKAYAHGIRFFDSARAYSDSEEKIGHALSDVRENIYISTKTMATN